MGEFTDSDSLRDLIREIYPAPNKGLIALDLDLILRYYGREFGFDDDGRFRLVEVKRNGSTLGYAHKRTFFRIDHLLRSADPESKRYLGFFVVRLSLLDPHDPECQIEVNGTVLSHNEFNAWLLLKGPEIAPLVRNDFVPTW